MKSQPFSKVRTRYHALQPNGHWFDRKTLDFFCSVMPDSCYPMPGTEDVYFISAEKKITEERGHTRFANKVRAATSKPLVIFANTKPTKQRCPICATS
jgi:hypothetical protein